MKPSLRDSVSNRGFLKFNSSLLTPHSLTHQTSLTLSLSHFSASLTHPLLPLRHHIDHFVDHPLRRSPSLTHPLLPLRQTFTTSSITLFTNHPLSLTLFSHSVKHSSLRRSPSSLTQSIWHSSPSTKDLIKHSEVYRGLIKKLWFQFVFFLFWLFWISNRTVKKYRSFVVFWDQIMSLGFWVCLYCCGIGLCFLVCLYLLRI